MLHSPQALRYWICCCCSILFATASSWSQEVTLTGKVIDQNTAREISGVRISVREASLSTSSDRNGLYNFTVSRIEREVTVVFEHPDYQAREMLLQDLMWEKTVALTPLEPRSEELVVAGAVRDRTTQRKIAGVRIFVKGTNASTASDPEGKFSLRISGGDRGAPLVFQHADYQIREVAADALAGMAFVDLTSKALGGSEEITISGVVRDRNTHREIKGVNVFLKDGTIGTTSDFAGRYSLRIPEATRKQKIVFRHIGYESREIVLDSLVWTKTMDLQPRVIALPGVQVEAEAATRPEILVKDLPQAVAIVDAKAFEIRGFTDAGDLLKTDQSVQVEEDLSGKKTAAIRGGNADEVIVMYNGVKMNSTYDNVFDLSLIELGDIERFEIIKGSNTALYGPEAFSGVINIVPKLQNDYTLRFQQRFGTYRSGNWGLFAHKKIDKFIGSYSFKRGATKRTFVDTPEEENELRNTTLNHTANLLYSFSERPDGSPVSALSAMYVYTSLDYENDRDLESLANYNQLFSLKYASAQSKWYDLDLTASGRGLEEDQLLSFGSGTLDRSLRDRALQFDAEKRLAYGRFEILGGYQFQGAELDFQDLRRDFSEEPVGLESAALQRMHHGVVAILKLHNDAESEALQGMDADISVRHDRVRDQQSDPVVRSGPEFKGTTAPGVFTDNQWNKTTFKFALNFSGLYRQNLSFNSYLNFGTNVKFPTLFQQISAPELLYAQASQPNLAPEENNSVEIGAAVSRDVRGNTAIYGWQIRGNFFQNHYTNKFRVSITPGVPIAFYDNSPNARISGIEVNASVYLFRKKVAVEAGISNYSISDKSAFPFKSDYKYTLNFNVDHAGYSFQAHVFKEGEQSGYIRARKVEQTGGPAQPGNNPFYEVILPAFSNLDLHLSKTFQIEKLKMYVNASGRNLLNDEEVVLEGLAIRDRRVYLTFGAQY
ncbi:MAG: carboxypeptidase-like regulatory domain-containing protein [bacterium]